MVNWTSVSSLDCVQNVRLRALRASSKVLSAGKHHTVINWVSSWHRHFAVTWFPNNMLSEISVCLKNWGWSKKKKPQKSLAWLMFLKCLCDHWLLTRSLLWRVRLFIFLQEFPELQCGYCSVIRSLLEELPLSSLLDPKWRYNTVTHTWLNI